MNSKPINTAKDNDVRYALEAMQRAGQAACHLAKQTHTKLVVVREGKLLEIPSEDISLADAHQCDTGIAPRRSFSSDNRTRNKS
jgi:hypothetical protein